MTVRRSSSIVRVRGGELTTLIATHSLIPNRLFVKNIRRDKNIVYLKGLYL